MSEGTLTLKVADNVKWIESNFFKSNKFFDNIKVENNKVEAMCVVCRKRINAGITSSSNLRRHYDRVHKVKVREYDTIKNEMNNRKRKLDIEVEPNLEVKLEHVDTTDITDDNGCNEVKKFKQILPTSMATSSKPFNEFLKGNIYYYSTLIIIFYPI